MNTHPLPVRTALEMLQLDFPQYRISMQAIGGRMFYLAEAARPHVQPRFAQAETTDRLRAKLTIPVREFTVTEPSIPRVWDVLLVRHEALCDRVEVKDLCRWAVAAA
jgi:hypothetical protein